MNVFDFCKNYPEIFGNMHKKKAATLGAWRRIIRFRSNAAQTDKRQGLASGRRLFWSSHSTVTERAPSNDGITVV